MCGAMSLGYNNALAVYLVEQTHGKWRSWLTHMFTGLGWNIGVVSLAVLTYFNRDMVILELIIGLTNVPFLLLWCFMPESPRWLLAREKKEKAENIILWACKWNKRPTEKIHEFVYSYTENKVLKGRYLDLFEDSSIRRNTILMCFAWFSFSMGYFGLFYNTPPLQWNIFVVFAFPALIGIGVQCLNPILENTFGRKFILTVPLMLAGTLLGITTLLPTGHVAIIVLAWFGTTFCGMAFGGGYTFTKELYPTNLRTQALSTASASARIGSILSPFIAMLDAYHYLLPILTYGAIVFSAGFSSIWIWPETVKIKLPDTLADCKALASGENSWISWTSWKKSRTTKAK